MLTPSRSCLLSALVVLCFVAPAQAKTMQQKLQAACAADAAKLCPLASPDADAIKACLLVKRSMVSADCMKLVDASE